MQVTQVSTTLLQANRSVFPAGRLQLKQSPWQLALCQTCSECHFLHLVCLQTQNNTVICVTEGGRAPLEGERKRERQECCSVCLVFVQKLLLTPLEEVFHLSFCLNDSGLTAGYLRLNFSFLRTESWEQFDRNQNEFFNVGNFILMSHRQKE